MLRVLVIVQTVAWVVGLPLLWLYVRERLKNLARESSERALADYRHQHDQALASANAQYERQLQEFSLFTRKRHQVYAELYRRVRIASDGYASMIGLSIGANFSRYTLADARDYIARHEVPASMASPIFGAFEHNDSSVAADLLDKLEHRLRLYRAGKAFGKAKNVEALYELYLSDDVRLQMQQVRTAIATVTVTFDEDRYHDSKQYEKSQAMEEAVRGLYTVMRNELQK